jgi:hypothetical protein
LLAPKLAGLFEYKDGNDKTIWGRKFRQGRLKNDDEGRGIP